MTMVNTFIFNDSVFLSADKRSSLCDNETGDFLKVHSDSCEKIVIINDHTALFVGGLTVITDEIKNQVTNRAEELKTIDQVKSYISKLCSEGHKTFNGILKPIHNKGVGTVFAIVATYDERRKIPLFISFNYDNKFKPVEFTKNYSMATKSPNDQLADSVLRQLNKQMSISYANTPTFLKMFFDGVSKHINSVSAECDIFEINSKGVYRLEGSNKNIKNKVNFKPGVFVTNLINAGILRISDTLNISNEAGDLVITGKEITLIRSDKKIKFTLNLTDGMKIQKNTGTAETPIWTDVNYQDPEGNAIFKGNVVGGKFYGTGPNSGYILVGDGQNSNFADLKVFRSNASHPVFSVFDAGTIIDLMAGNGSSAPVIFLSASPNAAYPHGTWNCDNAKFTNLKNASGQSYATEEYVDNAIANHFHPAP